MEGLSELLKRFKRSLDRDVESREIIAQCIKEVLGFDIRLEDVFIKGDTLRIKTSPPKRNAIKLEEDNILSLVKERTKLGIKRILY